MKPAYLKWAFALSLGGTLFAGYLSFYKLFAKSCAFNEPCPTFLGYPACWFGLVLFGLMCVVSLIGLYGPFTTKMTARFNVTVSLLGIAFAGYFTQKEIASWLAGNAPSYQLGLPTCAYGLVFYVIIFAISLRPAKDVKPTA
ncbi:MAG: hypothetical protein QY323_01300 [Patescibacteria group bacterium]|nr:MAG: hypothetical protein QY323_01300 [Patescibacteria group bacterium]